MHGTLPAAGAAATKASDTSVRENVSDDRIVFDAGPQWFSHAARTLLAPKPGLTLHLQTDCGERNGHRYASGEIPVPSYVLRTLLRSDAGEQWLNAIMDGSAAEWWRDMQTEIRVGRAALSAAK